MLSREHVARQRAVRLLMQGRSTEINLVARPQRLRAPSRHGGAQCRWQCSEKYKQRGFLQMSGAVHLGYRETLGSTTGSGCGNRLVTVERSAGGSAA